MMVGGTDTIPTTVEGAMTELLRQPDKMRKLLQELETVVGNENTVEESQLPRLLYLEAVVKGYCLTCPPLLALWLDIPSLNIQGFSLMHGQYKGTLSFGMILFGRRICVGISLAEKMVPLLLAALVMVHSFEWKLGDEVCADTEEKCGVILKKLKPPVAIPAVARLSISDQYQ
ncbi:hypothetical protein PTKIN_Ptkin04bG0121200 [Pterospermum kingtungense]